MNSIENINGVKTPLAYQLTEYDCAQATFLNAMRFLLNRNEIPPVMIKYITQYTLDTVGEHGQLGLCGTSEHAIEYLGRWINKSNKLIGVDVETKLLRGKEATTENKELYDCITSGGAAILRVWSECEHYVLCTNAEEDYVYVFDPYFEVDTAYDDDAKVTMISDMPFNYNRKVLKERLFENTHNDYRIVKNEESYILLLYRKNKE